MEAFKDKNLTKESGPSEVFAEMILGSRGVGIGVLIKLENTRTRGY